MMYIGYARPSTTLPLSELVATTNRIAIDFEVMAPSQPEVLPDKWYPQEALDAISQSGCATGAMTVTSYIFNQQTGQNEPRVETVPSANMFSVIVGPDAQTGCLRDPVTLKTICPNDDYYNQIPPPPHAALNKLWKQVLVNPAACSVATLYDNECAELEQNNKCKITKKECTKKDAAGACMLELYDYECELEYEYPVETVVDINTCDTECLDGSCAEMPEEELSSPAMAFAASVIMNEMRRNPMDCNLSDPDSCVIFAGEPTECKLFPGKSCCDPDIVPGANGPMDYIKGLAALDHLRQLTTVGGASSVSNSVPAVKYVNEGVEALKAMPGEAWNSVKTAAAEYAQEMFPRLFKPDATTANQVGAKMGEELSVDALQQKALGATYEFMVSNMGAFGEFLAEAVMKKSTENGAAQYALDSNLQGFVDLYGYYTAAKMIYDMSTQCDEECLQTVMAIKMLSAVRVTSYSSGAFDLVENVVYCKYSSPMARIMQEIAHEQYKRPWAASTASKPISQCDANGQNCQMVQRAIDYPECGGMTIDDVRDLDFSSEYAQNKVSEYVAISRAAGILPDDTTDILERATGSGNLLQNGMGERDNVIERTTERYGGSEQTGSFNELDVLRDASRCQLWGEC